uniref:Uncharacterized protein n=1 Tax=Anopheles atroparvus TaxID=41427 RepID=A0A182JGK3_ANOAO
MATTFAASKRNGPVDPAPLQQRMPAEVVPAVPVVSHGGAAGGGSGYNGSTGTPECPEANAKKFNAKANAGAAGCANPSRRKGSGSGLEGGRSAKPSAHSLLNYLFYLMCIVALGATVYTNLRQAYVEDKLSSLVSIEERLSLLEAQVSDVYRRITLRKDPQGEEMEQAEQTVSDVVRKISHQIAELPRMRRDLTALKVSRKDRQAAVQQIGNECMCPPGVGASDASGNSIFSSILLYGKVARSARLVSHIPKLVGRKESSRLGTDGSNGQSDYKY